MPSQRARLVAAFVLAALASGVGVAEIAGPRPEAIAAARQRANAAADRLTSTLMSRLTTAIREGGPPQALRVCAEVAQDLTRELGRGEGLTIRRTSLRVRNPANAPDPFERAWLERAQATVEEGRAPEPDYEVVATGGAPAVLRYLRPIVFPGGVCAGCHGAVDQIDPEVSALLRERYPEDRAIGFAIGDLRGAISVTVPLANGAPAEAHGRVSDGASAPPPAR